MRFRATLASLLPALLLSLSFMSSACESQCELKTLMPSCHALSAKRHLPDEQNMPAMPGMDAGSTPQNVSAAGDAAVLPVSPECEHHVCSQQALLLSDENGGLARPSSSVEMQASIVMPLPFALQNRWLPARGSPL